MRRCVLFVVFLGAMHLGNGQNDYAPRYYNYDSRPYSYSYAVSSPETGDHKSQWETRENGVVRGSYSLLQPDGTTRVVDYTADHTGFHPTVRVLGNSISTAHDFPNRRPGYYDSTYNYRPEYRGVYSQNQGDLYGRGKVQQRQPSPLLSSAYHGYDNLYH